MTVASFFAVANWNNRWGILGRYYDSNGHKGLDIGANRGEAIPAIRGGKVVSVRRHAGIGLTIAVEVAPGDIDTYCHTMNAKVAVGQMVEWGQILAQIAGANDNPGTAWAGEHLHLVNSTTIERAWLGPTLNPADLVLQAIAPLKSYQRRVGMHGVNRRATASTVGAPIGFFKPGAILDFDGWKLGSDPYGDGNRVWFHGRYSDTWFHSGSFIDRGAHDLTDMNPPPAPPVVVEPPVVIVEPTPESDPPVVIPEPEEPPVDVEPDPAPVEPEEPPAVEPPVVVPPVVTPDEPETPPLPTLSRGQLLTFLGLVGAFIAAIIAAIINPA